MLILILCSSLTKDAPDAIEDHLSILASTLLTASSILLFLRWEKLTPEDVGIVAKKHSVQRFLSGYAIGFSMAGAQALIVLMYGHFQLKPISDISFIDILSPLLLYFFIACREELAFRSYSLRSLNLSLGPIWALSTMAVIFIFEHIAGGMTWGMAVLGSGTGALLFGIAALKTKGLALSLGLHSAWNLGQWTFGFKNKPGIWEAVVEKGFEAEMEHVGLAAFLLVMALTIAGVLFHYRKSELAE